MKSRSTLEGRYKATWKREFKLPWREARPLNHHDDKVDSDHQVVNKELSLLVNPSEAELDLFFFFFTLKPRVE